MEPTPRRTTTSSVNVRMSHEAHRSRMARKRIYLQMGVAGTMLVIVALYVASVPSILRSTPTPPQFNLLQKQIAEMSMETREQVKGLEALRDTLSGVLAARNAQAETITILKEKIYEKERSATGTHP